MCFEDYEVSTYGNVRRKMKNGLFKTIKGSVNNRGYRYFQVQRNKKRLNLLIHHLVAYTFLGERPEDMVIDHINRDKLDNRSINLRYVTQKVNSMNRDDFIFEIVETDPKARARIRASLYAQQNREYVLQKKKEYYQANKSKFQEYQQANRERLTEGERRRRAIQVTCECGATMSQYSLKRHLRLAKAHQIVQ